MKNPVFFVIILLFFVSCSKSEEDDGRGLIINEFLASNDFVVLTKKESMMIGLSYIMIPIHQ